MGIKGNIMPESISTLIELVVGVGLREGFFRSILKLIVSVSMVSETMCNFSVPVALSQSPTLSKGKVSPNVETG